MSAAACEIERMLETRMLRRLRAEDRALGKLEKREAAAARMIGELASGKHYVWPVGGRYREGSRADLIAFLLRNRYV